MSFTVTTSTTTKPAAKPATAKPARSILIYLDDGRKVLVEGIPANAKVTYGKLQPGPGYSANALRIYTAASNQLAVFCNVSSFRDQSLTVKEQVCHRKLKEDAVAGPNGANQSSEYETEYAWDEVGVDSPPVKANMKLGQHVNQPF